MHSIPRLVTENTLLHRLVTRNLVTQGEISENELKKVYRELCKETHPDTSHSDSSTFQKLQQEYEEAKNSLEQVRAFFEAIQPEHASFSIFTLRKGFYHSLQHYTAAGLHSNRIRLNPVLRLRNRLLIEDVVYWARLYAPGFVKIFLNYNKLYVQNFSAWSANELLKRGRTYLLRGLHSCFDYEKNGHLRLFQVASSWLKDAIDLFRIAQYTKQTSSFALSHKEFAEWLLADLEDVQKALKTE